MSHPTSEPARRQRVNQAPAPRVGLFSHTPGDVVEQRSPLVGDSVDWRVTPFSTGQRRSLTMGEQAHPGATGDNPPAAPVDDTPGAAGPCLNPAPDVASGFAGRPH